jgi:asparagine synthetase B (glutamine-hydrolysing)
MCGICGTVTVSGLADTEGATLRVQAMLRSLSHRGPDAVGHVASASAVLGVTRLAIRGLQDPGPQPAPGGFGERHRGRLQRRDR